MTNLPEPAPPPRPVPSRRLALTPGRLRAAVSPAAVVLAGAGGGIGALDHSVVLAVVLAGVGWVGGAAASLVARARRRKAARPHPAVLDPWSLPEPWRGLVAQAGSAQARFDRVVAGWPPGPTRDRLVELQPLVWSRSAQVAEAAGRGAAGQGWEGGTFAPGRRTAEDVSGELRRLQREKLRYAGTDRAVEAGRREEVLAGELRDLRRAETAAQDLRDRLRRAVTRLDATIAALVSVEPGSAPATGGPDGVSAALDEVSDRLASLQAALSETARTETARTEPPSTAPDTDSAGPSM